MMPTDRTAMSETFETYRGRARTWLENATIPTLPDDFTERFEIGLAWQKELHRSGWVGIHWPREYGGQGLTIEHQLVFTNELVRARAPQPIGLIGLDVVGPTVLRYGTEEQRRRFVPRLLAGDEVWCQGFSEPNAGSDLASLRTSARADGDELVINGQKTWTSWAANADWCAVLARTDAAAQRHKGISYVLVDMRTPGITVRPIVQLTGDAEFNEVFFDHVRVPKGNVLGPIDGGWSMALDTLAHERAGYALRRGIENEVSYLQMLDAIRSDSEQPGNKDELASDLGMTYVHLRAFRALTQRTARRLLADDIPSPYDSVDKLMLGASEQRLFGMALDLLGPSRMAPSSRPHGLHADQIIKGYLYGRSASVYGGSEQIQRTLIAERLLGLPRSR